MHIINIPSNTKAKVFKTIAELSATKDTHMVLEVVGDEIHLVLNKTGQYFNHMQNMKTKDQLRLICSDCVLFNKVVGFKSKLQAECWLEHFKDFGLFANNHGKVTEDVVYNWVISDASMAPVFIDKCLDHRGEEGLIQYKL